MSLQSPGIDSIAGSSFAAGRRPHPVHIEGDSSDLLSCCLDSIESFVASETLDLARTPEHAMNAANVHHGRGNAGRGRPGVTVPEPATGLLLGLGALVAARARRRIGMGS